MRNRDFTLLLVVTLPAVVHAGILIVGLLVYVQVTSRPESSWRAVDVLVNAEQQPSPDPSLKFVRIVASIENKGTTPVVLNFGDESAVTIARVVSEHMTDVIPNTFGRQIHPPLIGALGPLEFIKQEILDRSERSRYMSLVALREPGVYLVLFNIEVRQEGRDGDLPKHRVTSSYVSVQ